MVAHLSKDAQNLLNALLQTDEAKRPSIKDILRFPVVAVQVKTLLASAEFDEKFNALMTRKIKYANERAAEV